MLDFFVSWAEQLIIAIIIIVVIEMILPSESSYKKYIKVILGIFLMYTVISPILSNQLNNFEFKQILANNEKENNIKTNTISFDSQIEETYKLKLKENMEDFIKSKGYEIKKMDTELQYIDEKIEIKKLSLELVRTNNKKIIIDKVNLQNEEKKTDQDLEILKNEISLNYDIDISNIDISESERKMIKEKITALVKKENKPNKKKIENLIFTIILLIITLLMIKSVFKSTEKNNQTNYLTNSTISSNNFETEQNLENKLEEILSQIKGVEKVKVLITYSETEKVVPIYNESSSKSSTAEKDNDGRRKNNRKL